MFQRRHIIFLLYFFLLLQPSLPGQNEAPIRTLIDQLGHDTFQKREEATEALRKKGAATIPYLKEAIENNDLETGHRSLQLLKYFFYKGKPKTERLAKEAIMEISHSSPEFYHLTFNILRKPSEMWLKNVRSQLQRVSRQDPGRTKLVLRGNRITDDGLKNLPYFPELTHLELHSTGITNKGLAPLKKLHNITSLTLRGKKITDKGIHVLFSLENLKQLNISQTQTTDQGLKIIADLKTITHLNLSSTKIGNAGIKELEKLTGLEELNLDNTEIDDNCLPTLLKLPRLTKLSIKNTKIKGIEYSRTILNEIAKTPGHIKIHHRTFLKSVYALEHIETNKNIFTTLKKISESNTNNNVKINDLIEALSITWLKSVGAIPSTTDETRNITNVHLDNIKVDDFGLQHVRFLTSLDVLKIDGKAQITNKGLQQLSSLTKLQRLIINLKNITDEGIEVIENFTRLTHLDLNHTQITDDGLKYIKKMPKLKSLYLNFTQVNGSGFKDHNYSSCPYFTLSLSGTNLTDETLMIFSNKITRGRIYTLNSKVTPEGRKAFKAALKANGKGRGVHVN